MLLNIKTINICIHNDNDTNTNNYNKYNTNNTYNRESNGCDASLYGNGFYEPRSLPAPTRCELYIIYYIVYYIIVCIIL